MLNSHVFGTENAENVEKWPLLAIYLDFFSFLHSFGKFLSFLHDRGDPTTKSLLSVWVFWSINSLGVLGTIHKGTWQWQKFPGIHNRWQLFRLKVLGLEKRIPCFKKYEKQTICVRGPEKVRLISLRFSLIISQCYHLFPLQWWYLNLYPP